jgi:hypothetical protein
MKLITQILSIVALGLGTSVPTFGQAPAAPAQPPDQISQLAEMVGLSEDQENEIRGIVSEIEPKIEELQADARSVQEELMAMAGPEFDETAIRSKAAELGALEGQMTAESILLQSKVDAVFTEEQRQQLEEMQRQQQQMRQQMQQQQMQQQIQQQMQQMQQQQNQSGGDAPAAE